MYSILYTVHSIIYVQYVQYVSYHTGGATVDSYVILEQTTTTEQQHFLYNSITYYYRLLYIEKRTKNTRKTRETHEHITHKNQKCKNACNNINPPPQLWYPVRGTRPAPRPRPPPPPSPSPMSSLNFLSPGDHRPTGVLCVLPLLLQPPAPVHLGPRLFPNPREHLACPVLAPHFVI